MEYTRENRHGGSVQEVQHLTEFQKGRKEKMKEKGIKSKT